MKSFKIGFKALLCQILLSINVVGVPLNLISRHSQAGSSIDCLAITNDGTIIAAGSADERAYIYKKNGTGYSHSKTLVDVEGNVRDLDLSGNGQWLSLAD